MTTNSAETERELALRRRAATAAAAARLDSVPVRGDVVVCHRDGGWVTTGTVSFARHDFMVVRCGDDVLQAFDVQRVRRDGRMWEATVV